MPTSHAVMAFFLTERLPFNGNYFTCTGLRKILSLHEFKCKKHYTKEELIDLIQKHCMKDKSKFSRQLTKTRQNTGEKSTGEGSTGEESTGEGGTGEKSTGEESTDEESTGEADNNRAKTFKSDSRALVTDTELTPSKTFPICPRCHGARMKVYNYDEAGTVRICDRCREYAILSRPGLKSRCPNCKADKPIEVAVRITGTFIQSCVICKYSLTVAGDTGDEDLQREIRQLVRELTVPKLRH